MEVYTIKKIGPIGNYDAKYGQRFWGTVEEAQMEVSFNLMDRNVQINEGQKIAFDERLVKTTKGSGEKPPRDYLFLRKVKLADSGSPKDQNLPTQISETATQVSQSPGLAVGHFNLMMKELRDISAKLDRLMGEDTVVEVDDKPITLEDFGGETMPEDFLK